MRYGMLALALAALSLGPAADAAGQATGKEQPDLRLSITTALGGDLDIAVHESTLPSGVYAIMPERYRILGDFAGYGRTPHKTRLILALGEDAFVLVPWQALRQAEAQGDSHTLTLRDGAQYAGKLLTSVVTKDAEGHPNTYDLATLRKFEVREIAPAPRPPQGQTWELHLSNPSLPRLKVMFPAFAFSFRGFQGSIGVHKTTEFSVLVGTEAIRTHMADFTAIALKEGDLVDLEAARGQVTSGTLKLSCCEDAPIGRQEPIGGRWMLVSQAADGTVFAVEKPRGEIRKVGTAVHQSGRVQTHAGLELAVAAVRRQRDWVDPRFKSAPPGMAPRLAAREGVEIAVVILKARHLSKNAATIPVGETYVIDGTGRRHKSPLRGSDALGESANEEREWPFPVPVGADLRTFQLTEEITFDLTKVGK